MDSLVPNFGQVGQHGVGQTPDHNQNVQQQASRQSQVTYEELDRPAKELTLEVLYQLSLKLQNTLRGNWASLAEILGYSRDKIDEFDHQSTAEYKPPGYLVLRDWTKQERGRSIYVLLESLKQCGRLDCVLFLEKEIKNLLSMKLHLKITDETVPSDSVKPYFLTVPTRCQATLKDSLENVFGGELQDYEICASWTDRAHKFKGMHLSVRRKRRSNVGISLTSYQECSHFRNLGQQNNLSDPNSVLPGQGNITCQEKGIAPEERNISPECKVSSENSTASKIGRNIAMKDDKRCPGHKDFVSEECMYCGKFRTFTQKIVHSQADKEVNGKAGRIIKSGLHCHSCTCDLSVIGCASLSGGERRHVTTQITDIACDVTETERGCNIDDRKFSDDENENVVSSTTDMDIDSKNIDEKVDKDKDNLETSGYKSIPTVLTHSGQNDFFDDEDMTDETFVKSPFHTESQSKLVTVVTENITVENDTENVTKLHPSVMTRSISDTTSSYQRLNRETMTYTSRFRFDNMHVMHGHHLGTVGDMFSRSRQHRSPIEHNEEVFTNDDREMLMVGRDVRQQIPQILISDSVGENTGSQSGRYNNVPQNGRDNVVTQSCMDLMLPQSGRGNMGSQNSIDITTMQSGTDIIVPQNGNNNTLPRSGRDDMMPQNCIDINATQSGRDSTVFHFGRGINATPSRKDVPQSSGDITATQSGRGSFVHQSLRDIIVTQNERNTTLPYRNKPPETIEMVNLRNDTDPKQTQMQSVPDLPPREVGRCNQISSTREDTPPTLPPRNRPAPYPSSRSSGVDSKFVHLNKLLQRYPEWHPRENENTVEQRMSRYLSSDGHYLLWYMASKKTLVLSVSHLRKLIHYAVYVTQENGQLLYFIFKGETFADLHTLLYYYKHYGLKPQHLQTRHSDDFLQQQNLRGSRQIARLSHVQLLHPVILSRGRSSV